MLLITPRMDICDQACDELEKMGILNADERATRHQEVRFVTSGTDPSSLRGLTLHSDDVVFVHGWEHGIHATAIKNSLMLSLAVNGDDIDDCVTIQL